MSAHDLGERLLAEVEEIGLDEILHSIQLQTINNVEHFGLAPLDTILADLIRARTHITKQTPPVVELTSLQPTGGKTHLLYHLTALAVLPTHLGGKQSCVVILDTDGRFSIPRLVQQIQLVATKAPDPNQSTTTSLITLDNSTLEDSLKHIHLFHPQSLPSTLSTLHSLPPYLLNNPPSNNHSSSHRPLGFIALDSASTFHWHVRAEVEDAKPPTDSTSPTKLNYSHLASTLRSVSKTLWAPIIFTSWHLAPIKFSGAYPGQSDATASFRPSLPLVMQTLVDLRLIVRRKELRKVPFEMTFQEAERGKGDRQRVVEEGRFECFVNEWEIDERVLNRGFGGRDEGRRRGFDFWIGDEGVRFEG